MKDKINKTNFILSPDKNTAGKLLDLMLSMNCWTFYRPKENSLTGDAALTDLLIREQP